VYSVGFFVEMYRKYVCLSDGTSKTESDQLLSYPGLPTPLQVFTQQGGLALLAQHLPLVYPETLRYSTPDKVATPDAIDAEWVKVDASDDIYEVNVCFMLIFETSKMYI
jgi:hypothetical protein